MVTSLTKLSEFASNAYEHYANNTSCAEKERRPRHQDPDSDEDVISLLSTHGNKKMPPFYLPIQGRNEDAPVTDNLTTKIIELQLATDDDRKYISQFCLSRKTLICQKHHFPFLFYVQLLHNRIALLEQKIALNNSSISGYRDFSLATTVYTKRKDIVRCIDNILSCNRSSW